MTDYTALLTELNKNYSVAHSNAGKLLKALLKELTQDELKLFSYYECGTSGDFFKCVTNDGIFILDDGGDEMTMEDINLLDLKVMFDLIKFYYSKFFQ